MTLEQITYFLQLAKTLSFTKTAENTFTTQPTVSRQIKALEDEVGLTLFKRHTKGITLTPAGEALAEGLADAVEMIDTGVRRAREVAACNTGQLTLGCLISLDLDDFLADCYEKFVQQFPNITFRCEKHNFTTLHQKLKDGELDLVLTQASKPNVVKDTDYWKLFDATGICVFSKKHPLASMDHLSKKEMEQSPLICLTEDASTRGIAGLKKICELYDFQFRDIIRVPNLETVFFYLDTYGGVSFLDKCVRGINDPRRMHLDLTDDLSRVSVVALRAKSNTNPSIHPFLDILLKESQLQKGLFL